MKDLSLFQIDLQLQELLEYKQARSEDPDSPPTEEELAAVDGEIEQYMGALARQVDGTAGLLLAWKAQREAIVAERARLKVLLERIEARDARLRSYVAQVMGRESAPAKGPRRLRGNTSELVLRASGGPAPLLIPQPELVPHELQTVEITLRYDLWQELVRGASAELAEYIRGDVRQKVAPSNTLIRQELAKPCPACRGIGSINGTVCAECDASGRKSVPGAYLAERGSWVEIR
jgi:hypothetical protein